MWCVTDLNQQFLAACEGLAQHCRDLGRADEFSRVVEDAERIARANAVVQALVSGVPVDFEALEPAGGVRQSAGAQEALARSRGGLTHGPS